MADPFRIDGPAQISFSGGRTSGYMLHRIVQAHGGVVPDDVVVCFANTGREMPATLDFVRDCGAAWNVPIRWLEYRHEPGRHLCIEVSHNSASRDGEPFEHAIRSRSVLPNPVMRFCTAELKIRTMQRFIRETRGWDAWVSVVGLRADEPKRVAKAMDLARQSRDGQRGRVICPLAEAGIEEIDVLRFWRAQPFDLALKGRWEGNCDGCFLKGRGAISRMARDYPERMQWWADQEAAKKHVATYLRLKEMAMFRADREDYAKLLQITRDQGVLPFDLDDPIACEDAACGV